MPPARAQRAPGSQGQTLPVITKTKEEMETFAMSLVTRAPAPLSSVTTASLAFLKLFCT